ncbi:AMP-binding protein [Microbulbifer sp. ANSA003]|uniref:AMP-binding protein n=1 Tax=unclassified Microbulbifer TaxID=2619833 RepID=UPI00403A3099
MNGSYLNAMNIGHLDWNAILAHARSLSLYGGPDIPVSAVCLDDIPVCGPVELKHISQNAAQEHGAIIMSSGGTTGKPKLAYTPYHQAIQRLLKEWRPLSSQSVLLNLFNPGRLWGAHYFIQTLAEASKCTIAPTGPFISGEVENWLELLHNIDVDSLAGAPTGLADFAEGILDSGSQLPIKTIIWMGEPWTKAKLKVIRKAFPDAGLWCDYGSVETNSIAVNSPECDLNIYHLLADQLIETDDQGALLTRVGTGWTVPIVRYRLGDLIQKATCPCGRPNGLSIQGRADDNVGLCSALLDLNKIIELTYECEGVEEVQLLLSGDTQTKKSADSIVVQFTGTASANSICEHILNNIHNLASVVRQYPQSFTVQKAERLKRIERTNKVPRVIWRMSDGK